MGERVVTGGHLTRLDEEEIYVGVAEVAASLSKKLDVERLVHLRWPVV